MTAVPDAAFIRFNCPTCRKSLKAPPCDRPRRVTCPACGMRFPVPLLGCQSPSQTPAPGHSLLVDSQSAQAGPDDTPPPASSMNLDVAPQAAPGSLPERFGRYTIIKRLGQGGMGSVYLARDTELDRSVALKVPHFSGQRSDVLERFYREARTAATLQHPHICPVYEVGCVNGTHYLTMALIEGTSLADFLRRKALTQSQAAALVRKLALALQEAHEAGIIHRDLKPANVMINKRGEPVIMDFGLARDAQREEARLTRSGAILGTPAYMPPEQVIGDLQAVGATSDIYSLGVVLYELLTGQLPFDGSAHAILARVMSQEPEPPSRVRPGIDARLEAICLKAMAKQPSDRYGSMHEFAQALGVFLREIGGSPAVAKLSQTGKPSVLPAVRQTPSRPATHSQPAVPPSVEPVVSCPPTPKHQQAGEPRPSRSLRWLVVVGAVLLLTLVAGITLRIRTNQGTVQIEIEQFDPTAKVEVQVDGEEVEIKGLQDPLKLKVGEHHLVVQGHNFETVSETFTVKRGENPVLRVKLVPLTGTIALRLDAVPAQAEFWIDGQAMPRERLTRSLSLKTGEHRLLVRAENHEDYQIRFAVRAGANPALSVRLTPSLGSLKIQLPGDVDELDVRIDGQRVERAVLASEVKMPCGPHKLTVTGPTVETLEQPFSVRRQDNPPLLVRLTPRLPVVVRYLPAGTQGVISLNVRQLLDSPVVKKYFLTRLEALLKNNALTRLGLKLAGLDPFKDVDRITMTFGETAAENVKMLMIFEGRFDETRMNVLLKQSMKPHEIADGAGGNYRLYELKDEQFGQRIYYAILNETTIVAGTEQDTVLEAQTRAAGRKPAFGPSKVLLDLLARTDPRQTLWLALTGELRDGKTTLRKALGCDSIVGGLVLTEGLIAKVEVRAPTPAAARNVSESIASELLGAIARLSLTATERKELEPLVERLNKIQPKVTDRRVRLQGELPPEVINGLLDAAPLDQLFKDMEQALDMASKPSKQMLAAMQFNNAVVEAHGKLGAIGVRLAKGAQTPRTPAQLVATLRKASTELSQGVDAVEREMKSWKVPDSEAAKALLAAFRKCLQGYRDLVGKDIPEFLRVVQGPGEAAVKEARIRMIAERIQAAEEANLKALQEAQKEFARRNGIALR